MLNRWRVAVGRFRAVLRREAPSLRQGLVALLISTVAALLAGLALGSITGRLRELPGFLVLAPAATSLRGNIGGALAGRLATSIHTGTFKFSRRLDTPVGENLAAALALSLSMSLLLAVLAKAVAVAFSVPRAISVTDFVVISVVGGMVASVAVIALTAAVANRSARRGWDLDNVAAPVVQAFGDLVTLPSLFLASYLAQVHLVTPVVGGVSAAAGLLALWLPLRSRRRQLATIVRQSMPVLALAGLMSIAAGVSIQKRVEAFAAFPAVLTLIPPFLGTGGAVGGIFSSRVATKLHLGLVEPGRFRFLAVAEDVLLVALVALPTFVMMGVLSHLGGLAVGLRSPGLLKMTEVALIGGGIGTTSLLGIGYVSTVAAYRLGLDPDNYAIPVVGSAMDVIGAFSVVVALLAVGVA